MTLSITGAVLSMVTEVLCHGCTVSIGYRGHTLYGIAGPYMDGVMVNEAPEPSKWFRYTRIGWCELFCSRHPKHSQSTQWWSSYRFPNLG